MASVQVFIRTRKHGEGFYFGLVVVTEVVRCLKI